MAAVPGSRDAVARRGWLRRSTLAVAALGLMGLAALPVHAQGKADVLRIGFQKSASLLTFQKSQGTLDKRLSQLGVSVKWVEFPAGPQLLEGLNVGAVDIGFVGEAPPIFAQAAGAKFVYVGYDPAAPEAEAIVVPKESPIRTVAELKGKKVALNKGSNVHYLLVKALEKNGLKYADITPVFLPPADARAAFERGAVDAWVIWDPFLAAVERQSGARILVDGRGIVNNYAYYLAERGYLERNPQIVQALFEDTVTQGQWLKANLAKAAAIIAPLQGLEVEVVEKSLHRYQFGVKALTPEVAAEQQKIADVFHGLGLIPKPIAIADALPGAVPRAQSTEAAPGVLPTQVTHSAPDTQPTKSTKAPQATKSTHDTQAAQVAQVSRASQSAQAKLLAQTAGAKVAQP